MKIHTFNSREFIFWDFFKNHYDKSDVDIYNKITELHKMTISRLMDAGINYDDLKNTLTPQKKKNEVGFLFDIGKIENSYYGAEVLRHIQKALAEINRAAIFYGDLVAGSRNRNIQLKIRKALQREVIISNSLDFKNGVQYFVVYINNLTDHMVLKLLHELERLKYFVGYCNLSYSSYLKNAVSASINQQLLLHDKKVLQVSIDGEFEDVNYTHFDFENTDFKIINIDGYQYYSFLCYKIKRDFFEIDVSDQVFSVNSVCQRTDIINDYEVIVDDNKFKYLLDNKSGSVKSVGGANVTKQYFIQKIVENINTNYLYNLDLNEYGCLKFNTDLEIYDENTTKKSRCVASFEIVMEKKQIRLITLY